MTEDYKDFLDWATPQLTVDQYQTLYKILYSFAGSPLHRCGIEKYINTLWFKPALENNHMVPRDYTIEHNTKAIIRIVQLNLIDKRNCIKRSTSSVI